MLTRADRTCRLCGYHACAPDCAGEMPEGLRQIGLLQLGAARFLERMNVEATHCWLPKEDFDAMVREFQSIHGNPLPDVPIIQLGLFTVAGKVYVAPHDGPTAWAFRERKDAHASP